MTLDWQTFTADEWYGFTADEWYRFAISPVDGDGVGVSVEAMHLVAADVSVSLLSPVDAQCVARSESQVSITKCG